jgi:hypothetical protein
MVLLINLQPEILVVKLSNQKVNILTGVGHGLSPFVLKILLIGNLLTVSDRSCKPYSFTALQASEIVSKHLFDFSMQLITARRVI